MALFFYGLGLIPVVVTMWPKNSVSFFMSSHFSSCSFRFAYRNFWNTFNNDRMCFSNEVGKII